ncbi:MAG: choice-of-anchor V domain-containing protein [Pyrinomonadaceae bacterium]
MISSFVLLAGFGSLISDHQIAGASAEGPSASHTNAPGEDNCTSCHASFPVNSGSGSIEIAGAPSEYSPGQQVSVTVTTSQADAVIYGFQLTAVDSAGRSAGTFSIPVQNAGQIQTIGGNVGGNARQYVEHTVDGVIPSAFGSKSWTFTWTAPTDNVGKIDFYAAGNAANSDQSPSGDNIYTTTVSSSPAVIRIVSVSGKVTDPRGRGLNGVSVRLTDANGTTITTLTSPFGFYRFPEVRSGEAYVLRAAAKRYRFSLKQLTISSDVENIDFIGQE